MSNFFSNNNNSNNNFFNTSSSQNLFETKNDNSLTNQHNDLKENYEQIFIEAAESIRRELEAFKPKDACKNCSNKECKLQKTDIFTQYPLNNCELREWQLKSLTYLTGDYKQKLKIAYNNIMDKKSGYSCGKCSACCRLATSEYSYQQLKQRAMKGDKFSEDFVSVFVPYESDEEAKKVNPEYFELLNNLLEDQKIYYYYCPKLNGNLCSDYENRPDICKNFPHNPLKLLPSSCAYNEWKKEISHQAMLLKAKVDIINFYKEKLS